MPDKKIVAQWMIANSFATGHGNSIDDLMASLTWQADDLRARDKALKSVYLIAKRENRRGPDTAWAHVIRICNEAGLHSNLLREQVLDELAADAQANDMGYPK